MITLGIDMSSQPNDTAACRIEWRSDGARVFESALRCTDAVLDAAIRGCDKVGIDAPFGWPALFVARVAEWRATEWTTDLRDRMRFRATDRAVQERTGIWPLSVSTDRIALPAMRTAALLTRHGVADRSGAGRFCEVYPAASLKCWGLSHKGYKGRGDSERARRREIVDGLRRALPGLEGLAPYVETDHALDALIASLTARAAALGRTVCPAAGEAELARSEGWIHLPSSEALDVCTRGGRGCT